ncbi:MAG TPA: NYN domain-containing protein [Ktedonobacterales bacterium]
MPIRTILIDGYNVIRNTPGLLAAERVSLAHGRDVLLAQVRATYRHTPHRVTVVFDGDGTAETRAALRGVAYGAVVFSSRALTADAVIARLAEEASARGEEVVIASDDLEVRHHAFTAGGHAATVDELASRLSRAPRHIERAGRHRARVRAQMERETTPEDEAARRKGNPRRAPRQRGNGGKPPL